MAVTGHFVSDLHLFSRRSSGLERWTQWWSEAEQADVLVLGGDIFDFRWSRLHTFRDTLRAARKWLEELLAEHTHGRVVYLLGNHDCSSDFQEILNDIAQEFTRFSWASEVWQLGDCVFLHGDILDAGTDARDLQSYRAQFEESIPRGKVANALYDIVVGSHIHRVPPRIRHRPKTVCKKLTAYLSQSAGCDLSNVKQVYFGHTHVPMQGYEYNAMRFYNAGSGVRHMGFSPHSFLSLGHARDSSQA
jgi:UDP-2,3-diacylglucosamine hydrolase